MLNAKDTEICANSDTFTPKASGLKHKSWPAIFRRYTVLFVEVRYSWRLTLWPFWGFFLRKKLLCRYSKVLFNMSLFSNNLWFWETAHVWTGKTNDFNRRVSKADTASGSTKGSQHKVPSTCILSNGRQGVTFPHNHKTVLGSFCLWPQYTSLCPLCKANNEQSFPFDQLWSF